MKWVKKVRNPISQIFCTICQIPAQRIFLTAKPSTDLPPKIGGKNTKCSFSRQEIETFHNVGSKIICLKVISYVTVESVSIKSGFFVPDKDIWKVKPWLKGKGRSLKASWWKKVLSRPHPSDQESSVALLMHPSRLSKGDCNFSFWDAIESISMMRSSSSLTSGCLPHSSKKYSYILLSVSP